jgi:membrane-bound lytic murein transglycosylase B
MFRNQLADLIQLDYENKLDALTTTGSYAGAVGLPQFMPESLMRFAVDGNGDGIVNVRTSSADAIASVANYLRHHGWVPGLPVFAPVVLPRAPGQLVDGGLKPTLTWRQLQKQGATVRKGARTTRWENYRLGVIDLRDEPRNTDEYRTATPNFFAITQYNHSYFYAASVADLAEAIADRMGYGWIG